MISRQGQFQPNPSCSIEKQDNATPKNETVLVLTSEVFIRDCLIKLTVFEKNSTASTGGRILVQDLSPFTRLSLALMRATSTDMLTGLLM